MLTHWPLVIPHAIRGLSQENYGSDNDLVLDGTKPLPEPMLTYNQYDHQKTLQCIFNSIAPFIVKVIKKAFEIIFLN